jgi:hypothetical protein
VQTGHLQANFVSSVYGSGFSTARKNRSSRWNFMLKTIATAVSQLADLPQPSVFTDKGSTSLA